MGDMKAIKNVFETPTHVLIVTQIQGRVASESMLSRTAFDFSHDRVSDQP